MIIFVNLSVGEDCLETHTLPKLIQAKKPNQRRVFKNSVYQIIFKLVQSLKHKSVTNFGWRGRWEGGSGWRTHVNPWLSHFNV